MLGREDGLLEVYDVEGGGELRAVFSIKLAESLNAVDGGYVTSLNAQELVLHTFSGKVHAAQHPWCLHMEGRHARHLSAVLTLMPGTPRRATP